MKRKQKNQPALFDERGVGRGSYGARVPAMQTLFGDLLQTDPKPAGAAQSRFHFLIRVNKPYWNDATRTRFSEQWKAPLQPTKATAGEQNANSSSQNRSIRDNRDKLKPHT